MNEGARIIVGIITASGAVKRIYRVHVVAEADDSHGCIIARSRESSPSRKNLPRRTYLLIETNVSCVNNFSSLSYKKKRERSSLFSTGLPPRSV